MEPFFPEVSTRIPYEGPASDNPLAFRWYDADRIVAGRRMADHLRFAVCYWHSFAWDGFDIFGAGTLDRPWHPTFAPTADPLAAELAALDLAHVTPIEALNLLVKWQQERTVGAGGARSARAAGGPPKMGVAP